MFFAIFLLFSCNKKQSNLEFEQTVFYEVFPAIIDSIRLGPKIMMPPPPPPIIDNEGNFIGVDTIAWNKIDTKYERELLAFNTDSFDCFASIIDTVYELADDDIIMFVKMYNLTLADLDSNSRVLKYRIDTSNLKPSKLRMRFVYASQFDANKDYRKTRYFSEYLGVIGFSRIQFNMDKTKGVLSCFHSKGRLCGGGFRIFIKKVKNSWLIDKVELIWIS